MNDLAMGRDVARRLEQTQVIERPGGIPGFTTFYASGTFTPAFAGASGGATWTYSIAAGFYTRIGNRCFFNLSVTTTARAGVPIGGALITGLPFTSNATANSHSPVTLDTIDQITLTAGIVQLTARVPPGQSWIEFVESIGAAPCVATFLAGTGLTATATIRASGHYML
jgi:hypothetical protein